MKTSKTQRILMLAAENGALAGGKVGGMGDVVRDIPVALAQLGVKVDVLIPGYQHFSTLRGAKHMADVTVEFRAEPITLGVYRLPRKRVNPGVQNWVIDHPMLAPEGAGKIYCDDPADRPFATDASKFALFCLAAAQAIQEQVFKQPDVIHLHDWHTALFSVLAHYHPSYHALNQIPTVYTIHNLSLQGMRPFSWDESALENWYRPLRFDYQRLRDPQHDNCYNPMRAAINLCDRIHAVSPTYVQEIQLPSDAERGFVGGEGLEKDLQNAASEGRLVGILNGCVYPDAEVESNRLQANLSQIKQQLTRWRKTQPEQESHAVALKSVNECLAKLKADDNDKPGVILTSVGRLSDQKMRILLTTLADGRTALQHCVEQLGHNDLLLLLGSGAAEYEVELARMAEQYSTLVFLRGYSDPIADSLYQMGDLFLMPSSFEPCGISQMLAMRSGQPCLVHHVGGLVDTVQDGIDGFAFVGDSPTEQAANMVTKLKQILQLRQSNPQRWRSIKRAAQNAKFSWRDSAQTYLDRLYNLDEA